MIQSSQQTQPVPSLYPDELILVVERDTIFPATETWQGFRTVDEAAFTSIVETHGTFRPRGMMEYDPTFKQVIPYLIFRFNNQLFVMQRKKEARETRLQSLYSIGIGGHIRQEDISEKNIMSWAHREFHEEVCYQGALTTHFLGIINDDSNEVGRVHIGAIYLLDGTSDQISIKDEHALGMLSNAAECRQLYDRFENWSQIVFNALHGRLFSAN